MGEVHGTSRHRQRGLQLPPVHDVQLVVELQKLGMVAEDEHVLDLVSNGHDLLLHHPEALQGLAQLCHSPCELRLLSHSVPLSQQTHAARMAEAADTHVSRIPRAWPGSRMIACFACNSHSW